MRINSEFKKGMRDGMPIALGYLAVSFGFGLLASTSGLEWFEALFISMFNLTSAGQLAAVPILAVGGTYLELAVTQLVINARYALMSVSLSQRLEHGLPLRSKLLIAFCNTDEIYAVAIGRQGALRKNYMYGIGVLPYVGWCTGTLLGAVAGNILPDTIVNALSVLLYAMFVAIIIPAAKKELRVLLCVISAVIMSCMLTYLPVLRDIPSGFAIVICTVVISTIFALVAPIRDDDGGDEE